MSGTAAPEPDWDALRATARAMTFVTASAGNHGLSVAAGAKVFGANAAIVLSHLEQYVRDGGAIMLVTHDEQAAERAGRIVRIEAGRLQTNAAAGANQTPKSCGT